MTECRAADLLRFVRESNRIEGITRDPSDEEIKVTESFLALDSISITDLENVVSVYQPGAKLRRHQGMDVRVGSHLPPPGGPNIEQHLRTIIGRAAKANPYITHCQYETLHPFMDGNGRSGRVLWAWMMLHQDRWPGISLGFLHAFYYQTLEYSESRR